MKLDWNSLSKLLEQFSTRLGISFAILLFFFLFALILGGILKNFGKRQKVDADVLNLLTNSLNTLIVIVGILTALGTIGVDVTALVASLGLTGFALGFALRDVLSNIVAGVLILVYRSVKRGDYINVNGFEGKVIGLDLRYTILEGNGKKILIPNSTLFTNPIVINRPNNTPEFPPTP